MLGIASMTNTTYGRDRGVLVGTGEIHVPSYDASARVTSNAVPTAVLNDKVMVRGGSTAVTLITAAVC